jgi:hypothetical protein
MTGADYPNVVIWLWVVFFGASNLNQLPELNRNITPPPLVVGGPSFHNTFLLQVTYFEDAIIVLISLAFFLNRS